MGLRLFAILAVLAAAPALAQRVPTLPGAWPLTGTPPSAEAAPPPPLPDRGVVIPRSEPGALIPGVDVSAGWLFEGADPTIRRDSEGIRPTDRALPSEARDQPRGVPGVTLTVPLGQ
jgi:hypothetical protein